MTTGDSLVLSEISASNDSALLDRNGDRVFWASTRKTACVKPSAKGGGLPVLFVQESSARRREPASGAGRVPRVPAVERYRTEGRRPRMGEAHAGRSSQQHRSRRNHRPPEEAPTEATLIDHTVRQH